MKRIFIITFFQIITTVNPCPQDLPGCLVDHGVTTDTVQSEFITFDTLEVWDYMANYVVVSIDTAYAIGEGCFKIDTTKSGQ